MIGKRARNANTRSVSYSSSPLLASKTPPWRSRFLVALVGLAFTGRLMLGSTLVGVVSALLLGGGYWWMLKRRQRRRA